MPSGITRHPEDRRPAERGGSWPGTRHGRGLILAALLCAAWGAPVHAQTDPSMTTPPTPTVDTPSAEGNTFSRTDPVAKSVEGLEPVEHLDAPLPLDLTFKDETGRFRKLSEFFDGERPVVLNLAYFSCPMLCNLVTEGLVEAIQEMEEMDWTLGDEFRVLTVSIDPRDTPSAARERKQILVSGHHLPAAVGGWNLLTGREQNIRKLAETVGFRYEWNDYRNEYAHGAVIILLTPEGHVSRYLGGIKYDAKTLRLSLVEASDGKVGSTLDKLFLLCYHYDPTTAEYGPMAQRIMRAGGLVTLFVIAGGILLLQRSRRRSLAARGPSAGTPAADES